MTRRPRIASEQTATPAPSADSAAMLFAGESPLGRRRQLDGVRGVAIALVIGFHAFNWPRNGGTTGVGIFFVLSGFLITSLLLEEFADTAGLALRRFYGRRALRLFPLLYAVLLLVALVSLASGNPDQRAHYLSSLVACALYVGNLYGLFGRHHELAPGVAQFWTLAVEEQFYLVWPIILLYLLTRLARRYMVLLGILALFAVIAVVIRAGTIGTGHTVWTLPTTHVDALLTGCAIAIWRFSGRMPGSATSQVVWRYVSIGALLGLLLAVIVPYMEVSMAFGSIYIAIEGCGGLLVLAAIAPTGPLRVLLDTSPIVYLGTISYGLYVIHSSLAVGTKSLELGIPHWLEAVCVIGLSIVLSSLSRTYFEAFFLRVKDRRFGHPRDAVAHIAADGPDLDVEQGRAIDLVGRPPSGSSVHHDPSLTRRG